MLELIDVDFDFEDRSIFKGLTLQVPGGSILHIRGANGTGKTTLLKLIAALHQPLRGEMRYLGTPVASQANTYQSNLCFVGHKPGINPYLSLAENCMYDDQFANSGLSIIDLADVFGLQAELHKMTALLSAGQQRQAALLRLWMTKAQVWVLDEPLVALDDKAQTVLMNKVREHKRQGGMVILTSHQPLTLPSTEYQEYLL